MKHKKTRKKNYRKIIKNKTPLLVRQTSEKITDNLNKFNYN